MGTGWETAAPHSLASQLWLLRRLDSAPLFLRREHTGLRSLRGGEGSPGVEVREKSGGKSMTSLGAGTIHSRPRAPVAGQRCLFPRPGPREGLIVHAPGGGTRVGGSGRAAPPSASPWTLLQSSTHNAAQATPLRGHRPGSARDHRGVAPTPPSGTPAPREQGRPRGTAPDAARGTPTLCTGHAGPGPAGGAGDSSPAQAGRAGAQEGDPRPPAAGQARGRLPPAGRSSLPFPAASRARPACAGRGTR